MSTSTWSRSSSPPAASARCRPRHAPISTPRAPRPGSRMRASGARRARRSPRPSRTSRPRRRRRARRAPRRSRPSSTPRPGGSTTTCSSARCSTCTASSRGRRGSHRCATPIPAALAEVQPAGRTRVPLPRLGAVAPGRAVGRRAARGRGRGRAALRRHAVHGVGAERRRVVASARVPPRRHDRRAAGRLRARRARTGGCP